MIGLMSGLGFLNQSFEKHELINCNEKFFTLVELINENNHTDNDQVRFKRLLFDTEKVINALESIDAEHSYLKDIMKR